jgi:hypothetical protein
MNRKMAFLKTVSLFLSFFAASVALCREQAQGGTLEYEVDPTWPNLYPRIGLPAR